MLLDSEFSTLLDSVELEESVEESEPGSLLGSVELEESVEESELGSLLESGLRGGVGMSGSTVISTGMPFLP